MITQNVLLKYPVKMLTKIVNQLYKLKVPN